MAGITQPLRDEHKELYPEIETLRSAADEIGETLSPLARADLAAAYDFLAHHLLPHAQAEEAALYPVVQQVMGTPYGPATMSRDHKEVDRLTAELAALRLNVTGDSLTALQVRDLRRVLYGLYAIVRLHFAKEEEVYLPLLEIHLSPEQARDMFSAMENAAHDAKAALHA